MLEDVRNSDPVFRITKGVVSPFVMEKNKSERGKLLNSSLLTMNSLFSGNKVFFFSGKD